MPALRVLGAYIPFLADDDLRVISKYAFLLRIFQFIILVPIAYLLHESKGNTSFCNEGDDIKSRNNERDRVLLYCFWGTSTATVVASLILETFIFWISSRGSPVEVEKRRHLPLLCAIKLIPLSAIRLAAIGFGMYSLTIVRTYCSDQCGNITTNLPSDSTNVERSCTKNTVTMISALAYSHIVEAAFISVITLTLLCRHGQQVRYSLDIFLFKWRPTATERNNNTDRNEDASRSEWWHWMCRFCCACASLSTCCLFGGNEVLNESSPSSRTKSCLSDISVVLADFFDGDVDVTPTDIWVGLKILSLQQYKQRKERMLRIQEELEKERQSQDNVIQDASEHAFEKYDNVEVATDFDTDVENGLHSFVVTGQTMAVGSFRFDENSHHETESNKSESKPFPHAQSVFDLQLHRDESGQSAYFQVSERRRLMKDDPYDFLVMKEGTHFIRLAMAVYGHIIYVAHNACTGPCCLVRGLCTTSNCTIGQKSNDAIIVGDNICGCNEVAFLRVAGLDHDSIAYISFKTGIEICPYAVVIDKQMKAVTIVVRGTLSLESTVADLSLKAEELSSYQQKYEVFAQPEFQNAFCHSGILKCALWIYDDLQRHKTLDRLLLGAAAKYSGYRLVLTGHSLGAACCAVLSIMLKPKYGDVHALCYSPPGCVLSEEVSSKDFITTYIVDTDIIPRLSLHSVIGLRDDVLFMIARINIPKYRALGLKSAELESSSLIHPKDTIPESNFLTKLRAFRSHQRTKAAEKSAKLSIPGGQIVHFIRSSKGQGWLYSRNIHTLAVWATREDFREIELSSSAFLDHDPKRVKEKLDFVWKEFDQSSMDN